MVISCFKLIVLLNLFVGFVLCARAGHEMGGGDSIAWNNKGVVLSFSEKCGGVTWRWLVYALDFRRSFSVISYEGHCILLRYYGNPKPLSYFLAFSFMENFFSPLPIFFNLLLFF